MDEFRKGVGKAQAEAEKRVSGVPGGDSPVTKQGWFGSLSKSKQVGVVGAVIAVIVLIGIGTEGEGENSPDATSPSQSAALPNQESKEPSITPGQENALRSAEGYLDYAAFSKVGLIRQLSSSYGEGFSKADATYAANNVDADWNEQAVRSARDYLDYSAFSKEGLIEQLSSPAGEGFTLEQARYGANKAYAGG